MQTKLTIRLDSQVISRAKKIAKKRGTSVSRMVSDYFKGAAAAERKTDKRHLPPLTRALHGSLSGSRLSKEDPEELPPITRALAGSLKGADIADYHRYLEKKYL